MLSCWRSQELESEVWKGVKTGTGGVGGDAIRVQSERLGRERSSESGSPVLRQTLATGDCEIGKWLLSRCVAEAV